MGSIRNEPVIGQYMHPLITETTKKSDPWERNYYQPPPLKPLVPREYPLIDVRADFSKPDYSPTDMLKQHGFGYVKHRSVFLDQLKDGPVDEQAFAEIYHREIKDLVLQTLGAKSVFIQASVFRQGKRRPEEFKLPTGLKPITTATTEENNQTNGAVKPEQTANGGKLASQLSLSKAAPVRVAHMDYTPLGARQVIRHLGQDVYDTAVASGVIGFEDAICADRPFKAATREADGLIAEQYNANGRLGPRYATYSIWRPLTKVIRDPLTFAPMPKDTEMGGEFVYWPYENKVPGPEQLGGDFLKEYAMLGVKTEVPSSEKARGDLVKWYYLSEQMADEVIFIKQFDSAALGVESGHAGAPWHASPEIGVVEDDHPRESIDVRVIVFW